MLITTSTIRRSEENEKIHVDGFGIMIETKVV
jgi:hypothetical protein